MVVIAGHIACVVIGHFAWCMAETIPNILTLAVFVPFSVFYMKEDLRMDYLWAGLCLLGAVFFIFRAKLSG